MADATLICALFCCGAAATLPKAPQSNATQTHCAALASFGSSAGLPTRDRWCLPNDRVPGSLLLVMGSPAVRRSPPATSSLLARLAPLEELLEQPLLLGGIERRRA